MNNNVILGIIVFLALIVVFGFFFLQPLMSLFSGIGDESSSLPSNTPSNPPTAPSIEEMQGTRTNPAGTTGGTPGALPLPSPTSGTQGSPATPSSSVIVVTYTDSGFSPKSVTIQAGQTVNFANQSSRSMWVGADDHPTHTKYPVKNPSDCLGSAFDGCKGIPAGQSWSFTFSEQGSWGYHNHTRAADRGTVVVQ